MAKGTILSYCTLMNFKHQRLHILQLSPREKEKVDIYGERQQVSEEKIK